MTCLIIKIIKIRLFKNKEVILGIIIIFSKTNIYFLKEKNIFRTLL